jgi:hypothetical protein
VAYIDLNGENQTPDPDRYVPNPEVDYSAPAPSSAPAPQQATPNYGFPGAPNFDEGSHPSGITQQSGGGFDSGSAERAIREQYQRLGGRAPDSNELATDLEAARRFGLTNPNGPTGGTLGQIAARFNNKPGTGVLGNPFQGWSNPNDPRTATSQPRTAAPYGPGGPGGGGGGGYAGYNSPGVDLPGYQFNDPYTKLLEEISHNQLNLLQGNNQQRQQLMDFLDKQFAQLSNANGYTPDELAILRTQAQEPIMAARDAAQQRELERTARAGYLPTSGITLDQQRQIDTDYGKMSAAAQRDLAINSINRQDQQRQQAINLGQLAMQIPEQQGTQALDVAGMLYQLPRQAMLDAEGVINGSSPQSVVSPYIQLLQQQQAQQQYQQQQDAAWAQNLGSWIAQIFGQ